MTAVGAEHAPLPLVLNVDDSDERLRFRTLVLEEAEFDVIEARTGVEALRLAHDHRPALVLLDVNLPDLDGFEVCRRLRASPLTDAIPVLHVTAAFPDDAHQIKGLQVGADGYLCEPISPDVLMEVIRSLLRRVATEAAERQARQQAERALRASERRYRALFEQAPYGACQTTPDGEFITVNHALADMLGYGSREDLIAAGNVKQFYTKTEDRDRLVAELGQRHAFQDVEVPLRRKDGEIITVRLASRRIEDGYETFAEDVTARRRLEEQRRQSQKLEAIGRLAGGIAHDFNNALTVILGYADMLTLQLGVDKPVGRDLAEIRKSAEHAASLTRQLLAFSRQQPLRLTVVDLNHVVGDATAMLERLLGESIALEIQASGSPCRVRADRSQLLQIVVNLAVNARDAMAEGGVLTIGTAAAAVDGRPPAAHPTLAPGHYIRLFVRDTGSGMDAGTKRRVFEPFFTTKDVGQGTGLGLSTVYGIVQQMGGSIFVESGIGEGTRFDLYFPESLHLQEAAPEKIELAIPEREATVLVVDDEAAVRQLTVSALSRYGYRVIEADGPIQALQLPDAVIDGVDLLLSDLAMPFMSGRGLARRLSARNSGLRILYMSGYEAADSGPMPDTGIDATVLSKPFTAPQLLDAVAEALKAGV